MIETTTAESCASDSLSKTSTEPSNTPTPKQIVNQYSELFQAKFLSGIQPRIGSLIFGSSPDYTQERAALRALYLPCLGLGLVSAGVIFVSLRRNMSKLMLAKSVQQGNLVRDVALSLFVGLNVSVFLWEPVPTQHRIAQIPLIEGKSMLSEELCPNAIQIYQHSIQHGFDWKKHTDPNLQMYDIQAEPEYPILLDNIQTFVHNCEARNKRGLPDSLSINDSHTSITF